MGETVVIVWPRPAVGKGRPRFSRRSGRAHTPPATQGAEDDLAAFAALKMEGRAPFDAPVRVDVIAEYRPPASWSKKRRDAAMAGAPKPTKPDRDNLDKLIGDALNGIVWRDDALICDGRTTKVYGPIDRTTIIVEAITEIPALTG